MSRHRMAPGDVAWLHMDRPLNRMVVTSVMWFDEQLDWDAVRELLEHRLLARFPRFSQRVVEIATTAWWQDDPDFDLARHIEHVQLPAPGTQAELERFVAGLMHHRLELTRPLWQMYFVDSYGGGGSAIVARIHHCIADGIALARVMMSLTDDRDTAAEIVIDDGADDGMLAPLLHFGERALGRIVHPERIVDDARQIIAETAALTTLVDLPPDHRTALHGDIDLYKRAMWSAPIPLEPVRAAAHRRSVTINDILLSSISAALREYLAGHDGRARDVRAVLPINLRPPGEPLPAGLGNRFGLAYVALPVSVDDAEERLAETHRRTQDVKHSAEGKASFDMLSAIGNLSYSWETLFIDLFATKGTLVVTNVPGPNRPVYLAGRRVRGTISWPPTSGNLGIGMSLISYDGQVIIGLLADDHLVDAPEKILAAVVREVDRIAAPRSAAVAPSSDRTEGVPR